MTKNFTPIDNIEELDYKIYFLRGRRVMLDRDLALLYGVSTKVLNQSVKRNISRFPDDFMFQLTAAEEESLRFQFGTLDTQYASLRSQFVTLNDQNGLDKANLKSQFATSKQEAGIRSQFVTGSKRGKHMKYLPYAFTEQGVAMLSSVLKSERAIQVNIQIMRTFTKIREMLVSSKELREKINELEEKYDQQFAEVFTAINLLLEPPEQPKPKIGFKT